MHPLSHRFYHGALGPQIVLSAMSKEKSSLYGDLYRFLQCKGFDAKQGESLRKRCDELGPLTEHTGKVHWVGTSYLWGMVTKVTTFPSLSTLVQELHQREQFTDLL